MLHNKPKCLKLLLDSGANVNAKNNIGDTALMYAAVDGRIESVKILLSHGANIYIYIYEY